VLTGAALEEARGGDRVEELVLAGGRTVECDSVLVGIGTVPATAWVRDSGLAETGIPTDTCGRTTVPDVFAAGDASIPFDPRLGAHVRTEHWDAAAWQGTAVARTILGEYPGTPPLPSFWSDQYGMRIQCVGHVARADGLLLDGNPDERSFEAVFTLAGMPVGGLAVDRPRAIPAIRRLVEHGDRPERAAEEAA
jgi:NADPH-dependent 2,4-dienoyl-CoA reductase/sulfur reductase-like enzyme